MNQTKVLLTRILAAVVVAAVILVCTVLPAEYGFDPTGFGEIAGLTGLADVPATAMTSQQGELTEDEVVFELQSFESVEYKYRLAKDAALLFGWSATGDVTYDLHAEPDGAAKGYAESFAKGKSAAESGSYTAPFAGIHGWFWENRNQQSVAVTLKTSGFYRSSILFRDGREQHRQLARTIPE